MKKYQIILLFFILLLISCSNRNIIYTFYTGKDGLQYFVKPSKLESDNGEIVLIDFTYQDEKEIYNDVICNFTIEFDDKAILKIDSAFFIINSLNKIQFEDLKLLFREVEKKQIRYSSKINYNHFKEAILSANPQILIYSGKYQIKFLPTKSFLRAKEKIKLEIIEPKEMEK